MTEDSRDDRKKTPETPQSSNESRRDFLTKAGKIAPLAIVATSLPAWGDGTGTQFKCGSAMASGNVSRPDEQTCHGGFSHGKFKKTENWPLSVSPDSLFSDIFSPANSPYCGNFSGMTLLEVINNNSAYGTHYVTAYLNSVLFPGTSSGYVFTTAQVQTWVNSVLAYGSVQIPAGGPTHNCEGLKTLFDGTVLGP